MNRLRAMAADERGLLGKILVLWIVLAILFALAGIDAAQILYARYKVSDAAQTAAFEAALKLRDTHDREVAYQAALEVVADAGGGARIPPGGFVIDATTGQVTVTVTRKVSTLLVGRFGLLKDLQKAKAVETSEPPPP